MEKKKIKVLRVISRLNVGGPALHCILLSEGLGAKGFETVLVTGRVAEGEACYETLYQVAPSGFELKHLDKMSRLPSALGDLLSLWTLARLIRRERPDIVHTHAAKAGLLGRVAAFLAGVPVVLHTFHGHVLSGYFSPFFSRLLRAIEKALAYRTTALITLSPNLVEELSGKFGIAPPSKFRVIPLGRDLRQFQAKREPGELRRELGLGANTKLIGCIGRLVPIKNHEMLFQALVGLGTTLDWRLLLVGDGELRADLEKRAAELGIQDRVLFLGWRSDLAKVYLDLDLVVLSSLNEGTPLSIIEAFASSKPVLSTDVGGVANLFTVGEVPTEGVPDGVSVRCEGALVKSEDAAAMARALEWMFHSPEFLEAASRSARQTSERFSDERLLTDIAQLYDQLHRAANERLKLRPHRLKNLLPSFLGGHR